MQRLPEVSDRTKGRRMCKEKGTSQQKLILFQAVTGEVTTRC